MRIEAKSSFVPLPQRTAPTAPRDASRTAPPVPDHDARRTDERTPGALRHLADGHYRGVADVRLRTVFHEELAALAAERDVAELSEPAGNGAAYAKFLAAYEELRAASAAPEEAAPTVDAVA
jgi:hypothetical protein